MIGAPLRVRGRIIGTVTAARRRPEQSFTAGDLRLLEELGERAAVSIENARLHREMVNGRARAEQLYRFAQSVVAADRVEVVFEAALNALEAAVAADRAGVLIFDGEGVMRFRASRNLSEAYRRAVEGHSPWARDAVAPQPVLIADVETDASMQAFLPLFREEGIGSLGFIPLVTRGRLIGKFMIYYRERHAYSPHEVELATAIASHLASVTARFDAIGKLEETIRYNELFAGVLAHDLRNPLGAIMTAAQLVLMRQEGLGDRNSKPVSRIIASGHRMTRMIDQLLDLTRARSGGGIPVDPRDTNLADLFAEASGELELAFPQWSLTREITGDLDGRWDPDRLLQIISNLLSNAGQHGRPEGVVTVRLDGRDAAAVTFEVHNGGAIPPSVMPSLFDPFRGTRARRDSSRGLGLGLFIVKEITEAHGGTVQVSSSEADGTRFVVRLPRWSARASVSDQRSAG
jgi:signal transduction histidine kinase